jgi:maleylpyruvate isomerase
MKVYLNRTSNAPLRVRIAIALKDIDAEEVHVDLERNGGGQHVDIFRCMNPQGMIPVLVDGDQVVRQSLAIIEYLEECQPNPALLPKDRGGRARVRSLAMVMACDGQPLLNLRVRQYLELRLRLPDAACTEWVEHWMRLSLREYESLLESDPRTGRFSHGDTPTLADVCLVPQVLMAQRLGIGWLEDFPLTMRIFRETMALEKVAAAIDGCLIAASPPPAF